MGISLLIWYQNLYHYHWKYLHYAFTWSDYALSILSCKRPEMKSDFIYFNAYTIEVCTNFNQFHLINFFRF